MQNKQSKRRIVLASQSLNRRRILKQIGIEKFTVRPSKYEEDMTLKKTPRELAKFLALEKAKDVARHYKNAIVIAGDTFITFRGKIIGKPKSAEEAIETLQKFSGKKITAISGLAIIDTKIGEIINTTGVGYVTFRKMSLGEIKQYVETGEPLKFAGSFGLRDKGSVFVKSVSGDFYSIVAFPLTKLYLGLRKLRIRIM